MVPADNSGVMEFRVQQLENNVTEIRQAVQSIAESLQTLAQLEAHHAETRDGLQRAFDAIKTVKDEQKETNKDFEIRFREIEKQMPTLKMIRSWVIGGVVGTVVIVGTAAVALVLR